MNRECECGGTLWRHRKFTTKGGVPTLKLRCNSCGKEVCVQDGVRVKSKQGRPFKDFNEEEWKRQNL